MNTYKTSALAWNPLIALSKVDKWFHSNRLFVNYTKTKFLLSKSSLKKCESYVMVNGYSIKYSKIVKYLGIVSEDKLK